MQCLKCGVWRFLLQKCLNDLVPFHTIIILSESIVLRILEMMEKWMNLKPLLYYTV